MMADPENLIAALYRAGHPLAPAFRLPGGGGLLVSESLQRIKKVAATLMGLGVCPGSRVSLRLGKSVDGILLAHACMWIGAIVHPLNTSYTDSEIEALLQDAQPRLLICDASELDRFRPVSAKTGVQLIAGPLKAAAGEGPGAFRPAQNDAAALLYTSGTTGKPKGALITHGNLLHSAQSLARVWELSNRDTLLHALPVYHAHGLLTAVNSMLVAGGSILLLPNFEAVSVHAMMKHSTVFMGVPTHYARLLEDPGLNAGSIGSLRLAISGSAPLPLPLALAFRERTGLDIVERYGSTEAAIVTAVPPGRPDRLGWVGWPLPGVINRVTDQQGQSSMQGTGLLETRGPHVFAGYWKQPGATNAAFRDGWFLTGDIAEIDGEGCTRILGREKDLVSTGGLNVYPSEVENELRRIGPIDDAAVFGVPHNDFGEAVVAAVKVAGANAFLDQDAVTAVLRDRLAAYKIPKRFFVVSKLPRNAMGKLLKGHLREEYAETFSNHRKGQTNGSAA
jgi:malonyl-CoA/methylmalonyl-CoA synthetase